MILIFMENAKINEKMHGGNIKYCLKCRSKNPKFANYCMKCGQEFPLALRHEKKSIL